MAFLWLINGGDPNYLQVPGMILQVKGKSIILFKRVGTGLVSEWVLMFWVPKQLLTAGCPWSTMDTRVSQGFWTLQFGNIAENAGDFIFPVDQPNHWKRPDFIVKDVRVYRFSKPRRPRVLCSVQNLQFHFWVHSGNQHSPWRWAIPKRKVVFQPSIFRCYVCLREIKECSSPQTHP